MTSFNYYVQNLEGFAFLWKLGASLSLRRAGRREPWERGCAGITKFKYERKNEKDSGRSSKMTPSCKWPIQCKNTQNILLDECYLLFEKYFQE